MSGSYKIRGGTSSCPSKFRCQNRTNQDICLVNLRNLLIHRNDTDRGPWLHFFHWRQTNLDLLKINHSVCERFQIP